MRRYRRPKLPRPAERLPPPDLPLETDPPLREIDPPRLREGALRIPPPERTLGARCTERPPPKLPEGLERDTEPREPPNEPPERPIRGALREVRARERPELDVRGIDRAPRDRLAPLRELTPLDPRELVRGTKVPRLPPERDAPPALTPLDCEARERLLGTNVARPPEDRPAVVRELVMFPDEERLRLVRGTRELVCRAELPPKRLPSTGFPNWKRREEVEPDPAVGPTRELVRGRNPRLPPERPSAGRGRLKRPDEAPRRLLPLD